MNDDDGGNGEWRMEMMRGGKGRGWHKKRLMKKIIEEGIVKMKMKMMMMSEQKDPGSNTLPPA